MTVLHQPSHNRCLRWLCVSAIALCLPLQGWSIAVSRLGGLAHVHIEAVPAHTTSADDRDPAHDHDTQHQHAEAEHHEHADDDASVIYIDDGRADAAPLQGAAPQRTSADIDIPLPAPHEALGEEPATPAPAAAAARFVSHVGEPLERPPR